MLFFKYYIHHKFIVGKHLACDLSLFDDSSNMHTSSFPELQFSIHLLKVFSQQLFQQHFVYSSIFSFLFFCVLIMGRSRQRTASGFLLGVWGKTRSFSYLTRKTSYFGGYLFQSSLLPTTVFLIRFYLFIYFYFHTTKRKNGECYEILILVLFIFEIFLSRKFIIFPASRQ